MIGVILLLIAIGCYFGKNSRWLSYILYIGFLSKGYVVLTDSVLGFKNNDLAIIYTFVICLYLLLSRRLALPDITASRWVKIFVAFMVCSIFFSYFYYHFTAYQILQGGRNWLLLLSMPILIRMSREDFIRVLKAVAYITLLTSAVYIAQIVAGQPLLPYDLESKIDASTGLIRLYNFPPFLDFYILLSFVNAELFNRVYVWRVILLVALICTLGRTMIIATILAVLVALWLQGHAGKMVKAGVVMLILMLPFMDVVSSRYEGANTGGDFTSIVNGKYDATYTSGEGGTMTYRLALLYERVDYLAHRPVPEQIFGMGLISDSQPLVHKMYNFVIGLRDKQTGEVTQLTSPDIAWVNTVCGLGFVGTVIYLILILFLLGHFYSNRHVSRFYVIVTALMLASFITSFSGSTVSEPRYFAMFFVVMSTAFTATRKGMIINVKEIKLKI